MHNQDYQVKKGLLQEAETRVGRFKQASLDKESMAYLEGVPERQLSLANLTTHPIEMGSGILGIRERIENSFAKFLKERTGALPGQSRAGTRTTIMPELVKQKGAVEDVSLGADPGLGQADLDGLPPESQNASMYFRWGWYRPIIPGRNTNKEEDRALDFLDEANKVVSIPGEQARNVVDNYNLTQFINQIEKLNLPLMSYQHNKRFWSGETEDVNNFISSKARSSPYLTIDGKDTTNPLLETARDIATYNQQNPKQQRLTMGNRRARIGFRNDAIPYLTTPTVLARCIFYKIAAGYTLNEEGLHEEITDLLENDIREFQKNNYEVTQDLIEKLKYMWFGNSQQYSLMVTTFRNVEKGVQKEFSNIAKRGELTDEGPAGVKSEAEEIRKFTFKYFGFPFSGAGKDSPASKSYRANMSKGKVLLTYKHMQMLLRNLNIEQRANLQPESTIKIDDPDAFIDPRYKIRFSLDGMSDFIGEIKKGGRKTIGTAPLTRSGGNVRFNTKSINLGGAHMAKNGPGVESLLDTFGPWAKRSWERLQQIYRNPNVRVNPEIAEVFKLLDAQSPGSGFFGAEVLLEHINKMAASKNPVADLQAFVNAHQTKKRDDSGELYNVEDSGDALGVPFRPTPQNIDQFLKYGYYIAKMMDFSYALMHRACKSVIQPARGPALVRYGQNYGSSSGIGGGGELLVSVFYAYKPDLSDFAGTEEALDTLNQEWSDVRKEPKGPVPTSKVHRTNIPQDVGRQEQRQMQDRLQGPTDKKIRFTSHLEFILAMSSAEKTNRGTARFQTISSGSNWGVIIDELYKKVPDIEDKAGDAIWKLNMNVDLIQTHTKEAIRRARESIGIDEEVEIISSTGEVDVLPAKSKPTLENVDVQTQPAVETEIAPAPDQTGMPPQPTMPGQPTLPDQPTLQQNPPPVPPQEGMPDKTMPKPMYIEKRDNKKSLFRNRRNPLTGKLPYASVLERLTKIADDFDSFGQVKISDKVDKLIKLLGEKYV